MELSDAIEHYRRFIAGRESETNYRKTGDEARWAMDFRSVTDRYPLYPFTGWDTFPCYPLGHPVWQAATRDAGILHDAWLEALVRAGRVDTTDPKSVRCLVRADGIADKPYTYHVGMVFADDTRKMSPFSQRDFALGCFGEKNQFQMLYCAARIRELVAHRASCGATTYLNADMTALKNLSRGLCYRPGGFGIKEFRQSML